MFAGIVSEYHRRLNDRATPLNELNNLKDLPRLLRKYNRVYDLKKQTDLDNITVEDEQRNIFCNYLAQLLRIQRERPDLIDLSGKITLEDYGLRPFDEKITNEPSGQVTEKKSESKEDEVTYLQNLVNQMNKDLSSNEPNLEEWLALIVAATCENPVLIKQASANDRRSFVRSKDLKQAVAIAIDDVSKTKSTYKPLLQKLKSSDMDAIGAAAYDHLSAAALADGE